ncbi:TolC family protein [Aliarcobacter butzleri]|uniref:TolC family protein n=1 Tax=Aliarcobacter butzleri TaxID=28197 RepID=UPI0021B4F0F1|nr:TolC family protein [Aliarcobacter butzleri]MCT7587525.1 TolC family protein [Aliarcobacter butzleri]
MKIKLSLIACIFTTISFASEVCKISSDEMLSQLLLTHPTVKMSQEAVKGAQYKVDSAFWEFFPTPSVDVSAKDSDHNTTVARIDQPIWTGGKLTSNYDIATSREKENNFELEENSYKLIETYLNILETYLQSKSNIKDLQEGADNLNGFSQMLSRRIEAGVSSTSDNELLNARIEQINSDMILTKNKYKVAKLQLELLLDKKIDCEIDFKDINRLHNNNIEENIESLLSTHPTIKKNNAQIETSKYEVDSTKAAIMPNVGARFEHREGDLYNSDYDRRNNQDIVYITFTATTNAGLSSLSEIQAAKIKTKELEYRKKSVEKELIDSLLSDYNSYEIANSRIDIVKQSIYSAQNVLDSYTRLFLVGKRQWIDLVNTSREVMQYKIELSNLYTTKSILAYKLALKNGKIDLLNGNIK